MSDLLKELQDELEHRRSAEMDSYGLAKVIQEITELQSDNARLKENVETLRQQLGMATYFIQTKCTCSASYPEANPCNACIVNTSIADLERGGENV